MITITNPETGTRHAINAEAAQELCEALHRSGGGKEIVFRAMRLDRDKAELILNNCGFETKAPDAPPMLGDMLDSDDEAKSIKEQAIASEDK